MEECAARDGRSGMDYDYPAPLVSVTSFFREGRNSHDTILQGAVDTIRYVDCYHTG